MAQKVEVEEDEQTRVVWTTYNNLLSCLLPVVESSGGHYSNILVGKDNHVKNIELLEMEGNFESGGKLLLLPGHPDLGKWEEKLFLALTGSLNDTETRDAPGAWHALLQGLQRNLDLDYVAVDCNPGVSWTNATICMMSSFIVAPCTADGHCLNAIHRLPAQFMTWKACYMECLDKQKQLAERVVSIDDEDDGSQGQSEDRKPPALPIPDTSPRFLGIAISKINPVCHEDTNPVAAKNIQFLCKRIKLELNKCSEKLRSQVHPGWGALTATMVHPDASAEVLVELADFRQLNALSHYYGVAVAFLGKELLTFRFSNTGAGDPVKVKDFVTQLMAMLVRLNALSDGRIRIQDGLDLTCFHDAGASLGHNRCCPPVSWAEIR
eukprot:2376730-Rhodomonas_salina.1